MESKLKEFEGGGGGEMFGKSHAHMTTTSFPEFSPDIGHLFSRIF